jgi:hypothetical protein
MAVGASASFVAKTFNKFQTNGCSNAKFVNDVVAKYKAALKEGELPQLNLEVCYEVILEALERFPAALELFRAAAKLSSSHSLELACNNIDLVRASLLELQEQIAEEGGATREFVAEVGESTRALVAIESETLQVACYPFFAHTTRRLVLSFFLLIHFVMLGRQLFCKERHALKRARMSVRQRRRSSSKRRQRT